MAIWNVPSKLPYALFVAGDARLGEDARPALNRVLEALAGGPPPAVELRTWIAESARMGTLAIADLRAQIPPEAIDEHTTPGRRSRLDAATNGMLIAPAPGAAIDPRAPWGLLVLAATMASASDGLVYDSGTLRIVPDWILQNPLDGFLLGSIKNHVAILRSTDEGGRQTMTTVGLNKYGLFELQLSGLPSAAGNTGLLIAGLAQAIVDARPPAAGAWDVPPGFDVTRLHAAHAFGSELEHNGGRTRLAVSPPDGDDVYWRIGAPDGPLDAAGVAAALEALAIGAGDDEALSAALAQATRIARNRLSEARAAFARHTLTHDIVLVKKRFGGEDRASNDLWLRVEEWRSPRVCAVVTSADAGRAQLSIGDRIVLDDSEIVDWRVDRRDGESIGNFIDEALHAVHDAARTAAAPTAAVPASPPA